MICEVLGGRVGKSKSGRDYCILYVMTDFTRQSNCFGCQSFEVFPPDLSIFNNLKKGDLVNVDYNNQGYLINFSKVE